MRELTSHKPDDANGCLTIKAVDQPRSGGVNHHYQIVGFHIVTNPSLEDAGGFVRSSPSECEIFFQNGPIKEVGVNGITNEALLAIVEDRLAGFQSGPFACPENAAALGSVRDAMLFLAKRTAAREARGVEGTHKP